MAEKKAGQLTRFLLSSFFRKQDEQTAYRQIYNINTNIHTHTHTYMHSYIQTYIHTYIHTYIPCLSSFSLSFSLFPLLSFLTHCPSVCLSPSSSSCLLPSSALLPPPSALLPLPSFLPSVSPLWASAPYPCLSPVFLSFSLFPLLSL